MSIDMKIIIFGVMDKIETGIFLLFYILNNLIVINV